LQIVERYLSGDATAEIAAIQALRQVGEKAAYRLDLQPSDVDEVGVDFAAFMLTEGAPGLQRCRGNLGGYIWQAARWFASKQSRSLRSRGRAIVETPIEDHLLAGPDPDLLSVVTRRQLLDQIEAFLEGLPEGDQQIFRLCLFEDMSCKEAAERLGCTPAAARKRLERLRTRLRNMVMLYEAE
jgi:RNA polymerase sigma factor (sigma-70 family)